MSSATAPAHQPAKPVSEKEWKQVVQWSKEGRKLFVARTSCTIQVGGKLEKTPQADIVCGGDVSGLPPTTEKFKDYVCEVMATHTAQMCVLRGRPIEKFLICWTFLRATVCATAADRALNLFVDDALKGKWYTVGGLD